jgi:hypothetical protein
MLLLTSSAPTVTVSEAFWRENSPGKGGKVYQNAFSGSYNPYPERGIWPNTKKGGGVPPHAHSQFCLLTPILSSSQTKIFDYFSECLSVCLLPKSEENRCREIILPTSVVSSLYVGFIKYVFNFPP